MHHQFHPQLPDMDIPTFYRICSLLFLIQQSQAVRNKLGHFQKTHHKRHHTGAHVDLREGKEVTATVSKTTVNGLEVTDRIGNILTEAELKAIMPHLARSTWFPIKSRKGSGKSHDRRGKGKMSQHHKGHGINMGKSSTEHGEHKFFRVQGLKHTFGTDKKHSMDTKNHISQLKPHAKRNHGISTKGISDESGNTHDRHHMSELNRPRHTNHQISNTVTSRPPINRRHHTHHSFVVTSSGRHENAISEVSSVAEMSHAHSREMANTVSTAASQKAVTKGHSAKKTEHSHETKTAKAYQESIDSWTQEITERLMSKSTSCDCENGGSCILKVACACPPEYYGIRCQHRLHHHSCGDVTHGAWVRHGCNMCQCEDGNMLCVTSFNGDCEETFEEKEEIFGPESIEDDVMDDSLESYIVTPARGQFSEQDLARQDEDNSNILTLDFQMLPLPSSGQSFTSPTPSLLLFVSVGLVLNICHL